MRRISCVPTAVVCLLLVVPSWATLQPGTTQWNPDVPGQPDYYVSGLPAWHTGAPLASLDNAILAPPAGTPFIGRVVSEVYPVNGVDLSGGLAFAYTFSLDQSYSGDSLKSAIFFPDAWNQVGIQRMGADGSGTSTPSPGIVSWSDGDPFSLFIDSATASPVIRWRASQGGTEINGGQHSSIIWFETDAVAWTDNGFVTLLDSEIGGGASIIVPIPEPASLLLVAAGACLALVRPRRQTERAPRFH